MDGLLQLDFIKVSAVKDKDISFGWGISSDATVVQRLVHEIVALIIQVQFLAVAFLSSHLSLASSSLILDSRVQRLFSESRSCSLRQAFSTRKDFITQNLSTIYQNYFRLPYRSGSSSVMLFTTLYSSLIFVFTSRSLSSFLSKQFDSSSLFLTILFIMLLLRVLKGLVLELKDLVSDGVDCGVEHGPIRRFDQLQLLKSPILANDLIIAIDVPKGRLELGMFSIVPIFQYGSEHRLIYEQHQFIECYHYMHACNKPTFASLLLSLVMLSTLLILTYLTLVVVNNTDIKLPSHHYQIKYIQAQRSFWSMTIARVDNSIPSDDLIYISVQFSKSALKLSLGKESMERPTISQMQEQRNYTVRVYYLPFQIQLIYKEQPLLKFDFTFFRFRSSFQELLIFHVSEQLFFLSRSSLYVFDTPLPSLLFRKQQEEHLLVVDSECPSLVTQHQPLKINHFCESKLSLQLKLNHKVLQQVPNKQLIFIKNKTFELHQQLSNIVNNSVIQEFLELSKFIQPASLWLDSSIYDSTKVELDQNRFLLKDLAQFLSKKLLIIQVPIAVIISDDSYFYLQLDKKGLFLNTHQITRNGDLLVKPSRKAQRPFEVEGTTADGITCKFIDFLKPGTRKAYKHFLKKLFLKLKFSGVFLYDNHKFYSKNQQQQADSELKNYFQESSRDQLGPFVSFNAVHNYSKKFTQLTHHISNAEEQIQIVNEFFRQKGISPIISSRQWTRRGESSPFRLTRVKGTWVQILQQTVLSLKQNSLQHYWGLTLQICQKEEQCQLEMEICLIYPSCLFKGVLPQHLQNRMRELLILKRKLKHSLIINPYYSIFSRELQNDLLRLAPNCMGQLVMVKSQRLCIIVKPGRIACHGTIGERYQLLISFSQDENLNYVAQGKMLSSRGNHIKMNACLEVKLSRIQYQSHYKISLYFQCQEFQENFPMVERVRLHLYEDEQYDNRLQFRVQNGLIFSYSVYLKDTIRQQ